MAQENDVLASSGAGALFFGVSCTIIPSDGISDKQAEEFKQVLLENGADFLPLLDSGRVNDVQAHSHIISTTADFPDYSAALDANVHVVRPAWIQQSLTKKKQAQTRPHSPDPALFFKEIILTCADVPEDDQHAIIAGVIAMGGLYSSPLTKLVTHVVSMSMDHDKCRIVNGKKLDAQIVLPHWFDDCLKLGKKINEGPYVLPNPDVFDHTQNGMQPRPRHVPDIHGATCSVAGLPPKLLPDQPTSSPSPLRKELAVLKGSKVLFSKDLNISQHLARTLEHLVEQSGGSLTQDVAECDIYVGQYRDGVDYIRASQDGKTVANLAWFYNVVTQNRWTNPLNKLLHYPVPRNGIPGFKDMRISISNYTGEARLYLENLCKDAGAEFTRTMKQDNTHLITAHKHSEKCDAAQEWNINIINHLWLEESYAKCEVQSLTNQRYTHFPPRTNLTEVVGQTQIDNDQVRKYYFAEAERTIRDQEDLGDRANGTTPHPSNGAVKPIPSPKKTVPASSAVTGATSFGSRDTEQPQQTSAIAEAETPEPQTVKRKKRTVADVVIQTPTARRTSEEKENESPPTTSSRASKSRAMDILHKQKEDIALFQREMKRKGGVLHGGRRASGTASPGPGEKPTPKGKKRTSGEAMEDDETDGGSETEEQQAKGAAKKQSKRAKTVDREAPGDRPEVTHRMLVSGDDRWLSNTKKEEKDKRTLRSLGIELTQDPSKCTLLCAPRLLRTRKFVVALAHAPAVVHTKYLDYALRHESLHGEEEFPLEDRETEERLGIRLRDSLQRAEVNRGKLLRGWTIFVTGHVNGGFETYEEIIKANGGVATLYRGRTGLSIPKRRTSPSQDPEAGLESQNQGGDEETNYVYLVTGLEDDDVKLWDTFRTMVEKQGMQARIVKTDWLLNLAMSQKVEWDPKWELKEELMPGWREKKRR